MFPHRVQRERERERARKGARARERGTDSAAVGNHCSFSFLHFFALFSSFIRGRGFWQTSGMWKVRSLNQALTSGGAKTPHGGVRGQEGRREKREGEGEGESDRQQWWKRGVKVGPEEWSRWAQPMVLALLIFRPKQRPG